MEGYRLIPSGLPHEETRMGMTIALLALLTAGRDQNTILLLPEGRLVLKSRDQTVADLRLVAWLNCCVEIVMNLRL